MPPASQAQLELSENPLTIVKPGLMIVCGKSKLDGNRCNGAPEKKGTIYVDCR